MYRIPIFQIRPEPDMARFMNSNLAGAGFENQCKTTTASTGQEYESLHIK